MIKYCNNRMFIESDINLRTIADSGQCFRMRPYTIQGRNGYSIVSKDKICYAIQKKNGIFIIAQSKEDLSYWIHYFDCKTDYASYNDQIKSIGDSFILDAMHYSKGMRILNQDLWEIFITFIIAQRITIERISHIVDTLCYQFGHHIENGFYSFPTIDELSKASLSDLKATGLAYRADYIYDNIQYFMQNDFNDYFRINKYERLLQCLGVGPKIANCIMLFGFHRFDAFPIDKWIQEIIDEIYDGCFNDELYDGYQGLVQQYIFYYYRSINKNPNIKIKDKPKHRLW